MNIKKIRELVEMMNESGLTEVEVEQEGQKIKLTKNSKGNIEQVSQEKVVAQPVNQPVAQQKAPEEYARKNLKEITSPMVGTFYRSSNPDAEPYVQEGDIVKKGDVVCIVEAMKLMNEVKSEVSGRIREVMAENAEPIEFGQVLFTVEQS